MQLETRGAHTEQENYSEYEKWNMAGIVFYLPNRISGC